ncbi:hypothetical protein CEUSTIGMA_g5859.t1 [Chlamydomonas eustigma]|uniref:Uncharacterized protein n=1 Tax=Chlamydomonas eustigma TaxID=1157962 RepID=A0A250X5P7_9CHLO|nr:hypothetical protein CEUSTIGMA_g5859.t1 [Chlamydomonas eustigma]|eukprot:GAX78417.1 hypothetical protein CEUSTIGMA_g5859.t1 [Chlamydomonas eustigma]
MDSKFHDMFKDAKASERLIHTNKNDFAGDSDRSVPEKCNKKTQLSTGLSFLKDVSLVIRRQPATTLTAPCLLFILLYALGIYGAIAGAGSVENENKSVATNLAVDTSVSFKLSIEQAYAPLITISTFIQLIPNASLRASQFPIIAKALLSQFPPGTFHSLRLKPFGQHRGMDS